MRKYVLPVVVCVAIGALIVVLVQIAGDDTPTRPDGPLVADETGGTDEPGKGLPFDPAKTRTKLGEHRYLREFERALTRPDMKNARWYQQRVCEDIDRIGSDPKLAGNLLALIREHGIESDDLKRRDVMLQILRVLKHPDATAMIGEEYYRARTPEERMLLLEAMSHSYHDPERAAIWATEMALNEENEERRTRAFEVVDRFSENDDLVIATGAKIYAATTSMEQRLQMLEAINRRSSNNKNAEAFMRQRLMKPRVEELGLVLEQIAGWGTEEDAAYVESLIPEFPSESDFLKERARWIRITKKRMREVDEREIAEAEFPDGRPDRPKVPEDAPPEEDNPPKGPDDR